MHSFPVDSVLLLFSLEVCLDFRPTAPSDWKKITYNVTFSRGAESFRITTSIKQTSNVTLKISNHSPQSNDARIAAHPRLGLASHSCSYCHTCQRSPNVSRGRKSIRFALYASRKIMRLCIFFNEARRVYRINFIPFSCVLRALIQMISFLNYLFWFLQQV